MNGHTESLPTPHGSYWDASASEHKLAVATTVGEALIVEGLPLRVSARNNLCHGPIVGLRFVYGRQAVAYACRDGAIGLWNIQYNTTSARTQLEGHADLITVSAAGDYIVAAGGNGTLAVIDLNTDLITAYKGHGFRLTSITAPTREHPVLISADVH